MSIYVKADSPRELLSSIRDKVNVHMVNTWEIDSEGDFTYTSESWRYKAWFHPIVNEDMLVFAIWGRKSNNLSVKEYAIYHGKFVSMLLEFFDHMMASIEVTPLATAYDSIDAENEQNEKS